MRASVKDAKRVFTDDTGRRINGESAYMRGFDELIPSDYGSMMHTDRALTYDAWALELVAQQKWVVLNME